METKRSRWTYPQLAWIIMALFMILFSGCWLPAKNRIGIGPVMVVSQEDRYVAEPHITVDPTESNHLAVSSYVLSEYDCREKCKITTGLYTSHDGGKTWLRQLPFERFTFSGNATVGFDPNGKLYLAALAGTSAFTLVVARGDENDRMPAASLRFPSHVTGVDKPWLTIDLQSGELYLPSSSGLLPANDRIGMTLVKSADGGETWSSPVPFGHAVSLTDYLERKTLFPWNTQLMLGGRGNLAIAWEWRQGWLDPDRTSSIYMTLSSNDGQTFSDPVQVAETWNHFSSTSYQGAYYVVYSRGSQMDQELVIAISKDQGKTWETHLVSGEIQLYFLRGMTAGVNVAPDGTIDVAFYAHDQSAPKCINLDLIRAFSQGETPKSEELIDLCSYNIYYTYSQDGGMSFSKPVQLNSVPILGERVARRFGSSIFGDYIGMASTDQFAYPVWIDTDQDGPRVVMAKIER